MNFGMLKCKLNHHDWEVIKRENKGTLIVRLEQEIYLNHNVKKDLQQKCLNKKFVCDVVPR